MKTNLRIVLLASAPTCLFLLPLSSCKKDDNTNQQPDQTAPGGGLAFSRIDAQTHTADVMRAAIEMQTSGEPLAEAMGRNLDGYDRTALIPDQYTFPADANPMIDLVGYSSAVESYEYSKIMMNTISFESGPGLSLMYGPVLNPTKTGGAAALGLLRDRVQKLAIASHGGQDANGPWVIVPAPTDNPLNLLGFPGLFPEFAEFEDFSPDMVPSGNVVRGCSLDGGYGAAAGTKITAGDYECGYNSLAIDRGTSAEKILTLDAMGFAAWKQSLWANNYFQLVHDVDGNSFTHVAEADIANVGITGNMVKADNNDGTSDMGAAGTWIGSSDLEGFQGMLMCESIDNKAEFLIKQVAGFTSVMNALSYDWNSALTALPHRIATTEVAGTASADPMPGAVTVKDASSQLGDMSALIGGFAEAFALTDKRNPDVGGSSTTRAVFDGNPFPLDNGMADGEATLHDRSLAVLKVALVNLDRLHVDPSGNVLVDSATVQGGTAMRTRHATTVELDEAIFALRTAYRALTAQLTLYSNATPDTMVTTTALDSTSMAGIPGGVKLAQRIQQIIKAQADFISQKLVDGDGLAKNGYDLAGSSADATATTIEAQAAAVRGLLEAYLATSDTSYRDRATAAYAVLESRFYEPSLRIYRTTISDDNTFTWTPVRFGKLQAALRQMYLLIGSSPGNEQLATQLQTRLGRLNKLILNGWDDRNDDGKVDYPGECLNVRSALPRGGLLLGERALTGELGSIDISATDMQSLQPTSDRDKDCVPEIDDAQLGGLLAKEWVLVRK